MIAPERFPPKACPGPYPGLLDFGDKEALQDICLRAFFTRSDRIIPIRSEWERLYVSLFRNSKIGKALTIGFSLDGTEFVALNGGPHFKFSEAVSFTIDCQSQAEADDLWEKLSAGGSKGQCGWLKDKYGLSWQIVPGVLVALLSDPEGHPHPALRATFARRREKREATTETRNTSNAIAFPPCGKDKLYRVRPARRTARARRAPRLRGRRRSRAGHARDRC